MPAKKKAKKKQTKRSKPSAKKIAKRRTRQKPAKKAKKKAPARTRTAARARTVRRGPRPVKAGARPESGSQAGELEGLSRTERADSESVGELLEEGNSFEADAVAGVEEADDSDEREVFTHEVPEDDVPEEYLDKDE